MPYAVINTTGCGIHKNKAKLRLDFYLSPGDPNYGKHKGVFHTHFIYPDKDATDEVIKADIDRCLSYFYAFHQHCWDNDFKFIDEWKKVPRIKGSIRDLFSRGNPQELLANEAKVQDILSRVEEFHIDLPEGTSQELNIGEKGTIDIGAGAIDRNNTLVPGYTDIDKENPANDSGTIDTFEVWSNINLTGTNKVGTFYGSETAYTNRDGETIGTVTGGAKRTFTGLDIDVESGDFAGMYWSVGAMEYEMSGGTALYYKSGDQFGAGQQTYTYYSAGMLSMYGTGTEGGAIQYLAGISNGIASVSGAAKILKKITGAISGVASVIGVLTHITQELYEHYNTGDNSGNSFWTTLWRGQSFTPTIAHKITSVKLKLYRTGSPGILTVGIRNVDGSGHPTGEDLCSGTTDGDTLTDNINGEWRKITLGNGYNLLADTKYAIVARIAGGDSGNKVGWRYDNSSPTYAGGVYLNSSDSGDSWAHNDTIDHMFEEWGKSAFKLLAGIINGVASVLGVTKISKKIAGGITGIASVSGSTKISKKIQAGIAGIASVSGSLINQKWLQGAISGVASVLGAIKTSRKLQALVSGVASVTGDLSTVGTVLLAGIINGVATVAGAIKASRKLAGTITGIASISGAIKILKELQGAIAGVASVTGSLTIAGLVWLAGVISGVASVSGAVKITRKIAGVISGNAVVAGILKIVKFLPLNRPYTIEVRNGDGDLVAVLENARGIDYRQEINAPQSLRFEVPATDSKVDNILLANEYWLRDSRTGIVIRKFKLQHKRDTR